MKAISASIDRLSQLYSIISKCSEGFPIYEMDALATHIPSTVSLILASCLLSHRISTWSLSHYYHHNKDNLTHFPTWPCTLPHQISNFASSWQLVLLKHCYFNVDSCQLTLNQQCFNVRYLLGNKIANLIKQSDSYN